jgi:uncharacterized membrane protein YqjE
MATQHSTDQPIGELVQQLSEQTSTLVRKEIRLAQLELQEKGKRAGIGAGMFGGTALIALYGLGALITAAVLGLASAMAAWLSALIVAVVLFAIAGVLALTGKQQVDQATPPKPEAAMESVQRDIDTVKGRAKRR